MKINCIIYIYHLYFRKDFSRAFRSKCETLIKIEETKIYIYIYTKNHEF